MATKKTMQLGSVINAIPKIHYILGIDGGGSKTVARLINIETQEQWQAVSGPSSLSNDFNGAVSVLKSLIDEVTKQANCQVDEVVAVFGLAGAGNCDAVTKLKLEFAHCFISLAVYSDAVTSAYGANDGHEVAVVALGTGSVGIRLHLNPQGKLTSYIVGGWGFLIGDEGGGAKLGYHAVQALVNEYQRHGYVSSKLSKVIAAIITSKANDNINSEHVITPQQISAWLACAKPVDFAKLSPYVMQHKSDCLVAKKIITNHIANVERLIADTRANTSLPVVLLGGLAPITEELLSMTTKKSLSCAKGDALDGACLLAKITLEKIS